MAGDERLDIISSALAALVRRQDRIEERLAAIERALSITPTPASVEPPPPGPPPAPPPLPPPAIPKPQPPPAEPLEAEMGLRWVNRVGAVTLVLAAAFFFKLAVENQWIGPAGRVILGILAGFGTLGVADMLWRRGHRVYAQGVSGMGVAILYLSFYASFGFYHLIPQPLAFVLMVFCTAMACALALRYDSSAIAAIGLLGGYATPILLSTGVDRPWFFFGFLLLLNAAAIVLERLRSWPKLAWLALAATAALYSLWMVEHFRAEKRAVAAIYDFAFYAVFATSPSLVIFLIAQALATLVLAGIFDGRMMPFSLSLVSISLLGLAISASRNRPAATLATLASSWAAYAIFYSDMAAPLPTAPLLTLAACLFGIFFAWTPWRAVYRSATFSTAELAAAALNAGSFFLAGYLLLQTSYASYTGLFAVALAAVHLALGYLLWRRDSGTAVLTNLAIALALLTLAAPIQFAGFRITMAWMLEATALTWIGVRTASTRTVRVALVIFALGAARLFGLDAWIFSDPGSHTLIANGRFVTFAVSALCLWLAAWWTRLSPIAIAPYMSGHVVMLWCLSQELMTWSRRVSTPETLGNVQSASLSILWAAYAVVLIASGVIARISFSRILGLGLMAVVVLKLYLSDIWQLRMAYRVTAFAALGVLLLLTSFLYSRYRDTLGAWLRDEPPPS